MSHHNESFASAMTKNVARCANKWRQVEAIRKAVVARKKAAERSEVSGTAVAPEESKYPYYFGTFLPEEIVITTVVLSAVAMLGDSTPQEVADFLRRKWSASWEFADESELDLIQEMLRSLVRRDYVLPDDNARRRISQLGLDALAWLDEKVSARTVPIDLPMFGSTVLLSLHLITFDEKLDKFLRRFPGHEEHVKESLSVLSREGLVRLEAELRGDTADPKNWTVQALVTRDSAVMVARWFL